LKIRKVKAKRSMQNAQGLMLNAEGSMQNTKRLYIRMLH